MRKLVSSLAPAVLALGLVACSQPEPPAAATATAPATAPAEPVVVEPAPAPAPQETVLPGVTFTIEQVTSDCNPETHYRAMLSWTIADPARAAVEVRVDGVEGPLLAMITATHHSTETGDWVRQGTRFFLVDKQTREVLATATAAAEICQ